MAKPATSKLKPKSQRGMVPGSFDARVDAKIASASVALQPVLNHIRGLVHDTVPEVTETIKWGMPFFEVNGLIFAHMGIFKHHCSLGFWSRTMSAYLVAKGVRPEKGAGSFGRIAAMDDLPSYQTLAGYFQEAAAQIRNGQWQSPFAARHARAAKPEPAVPNDFAAALNLSPSAGKHFDSLSPSCRREYLAWITSAKREETRTRRIASAIADIAQGKPHRGQATKSRPA